MQVPFWLCPQLNILLGVALARPGWWRDLGVPAHILLPTLKCFVFVFCQLSYERTIIQIWLCNIVNKCRCWQYKLGNIPFLLPPRHNSDLGADNKEHRGGDSCVVHPEGHKRASSDQPHLIDWPWPPILLKSRLLSLCGKTLKSRNIS